MDIKIQSSISHKSRQDILSHLRLTSNIARQLDGMYLKDFTIGNERAKNHLLYKRPLMNAIEKIINDQDFTKPVIDTFTKDEVKVITDNLNKMRFTQGFQNKTSLFKAFFNEYLVNRYLMSKETNDAAYEEKMNVVDALISKLQ